MLTCVWALLYASGLLDRVPMCARHHTGQDWTAGRRFLLSIPGFSQE